MDKRNIRKIEILQTEAERALDERILSDVNAEFEDRSKVVSKKAFLESEIVNEAKAIRSFMCAELQRRKHIFYRLGVQALNVQLSSVNKDTEVNVIFLQTTMFDTEDDLDSFTRSGWLFSLSYLYGFREGFQQKAKPDFAKSDLVVVRKSVSLDNYMIAATEPWYKITLNKSAPDLPVHLMNPTVLSLGAANDHEQDKQYRKYEAERNDEFNARFEEIKARTSKEDWEILVSREMYEPESKEITGQIRPGSSIDSLKHCCSIMRLGSKTLQVK